MDDGAGLTRPGPPCGPMDHLCFPHPRSSALRWSSGRRLPAIVSDLHWGRSLNPGPHDQPLPVHPGAWSPACCLPVGLCLLWVHLAITTQLKPSKGSLLSSPFILFAYFRQTLAGILPHRALGGTVATGTHFSPCFEPKIVSIFILFGVFLNIRAKIKHLLIW